jgi:hypothetical protein
LIGHLSAYNGTCQNIRTIRCLAGTPFERRFRPIIAALVHFRAVEEATGLGPELLSNIVGQLPGEAILVPFVVFGGTVARYPGFLSETEKHAWFALQTCILRMLRNDPVFTCKVVSVQADIGI